MSTPTFNAAMNLLEIISKHTSTNAMVVPLQIPNFAFGGSFDDAACAFYEISSDPADSQTDDQLGGDPVVEERTPINSKPHFPSAVPFVASFEYLAGLASSCVETSVNNKELVEGNKYGTPGFGLLGTFVRSISLILELITSLGGFSFPPGSPPLKISWNVREWFDCICRPLRVHVSMIFRLVVRTFT